MKTTNEASRPTHRRPPVDGLSVRALATPEPFVRLFSRRVQQEGALDLTQGDYKNADFAPHPEVVRAAQRITRNTVHSYGPSVGRMDVRSEVADFFNRDGLLDYPGSEVRFLPDEVIFTPGTRAGLAFVLEVLGADGSGVVVPRPSWEYDWFIERAGKTVVDLPTKAPEFLPDPEALDRLLGKGGISSVIINNPHNPTGRVYPRALVEDLVRVAVKHRCYVLYDSVYQRLDYVGWFVNPAFAHPEWRDWVISLSGLSKMDMFGASTGARACWLVISDQIRANGVRAREILTNLSAWLVATPSTLAQDWALAALQSPLAALRRPSPYMRERRDFMVKAADELRSLGLGIERTDFGGTFYSPLAFPGLVGEPFDRLRNGVHEKAVVKDSVDAFELLLSGGIGGIPFIAFAGSQKGAADYGTWQRLSYGSKDVKELAVFMDRVRTCLVRQSRIGSSAPAAVLAAERSAHSGVWESVCTTTRYDALDGLDPKAFAVARRRFLDDPRHEALRLTGTKHPDSTAHRAEQLDRALSASPLGAPDRAQRALTHIEWHPLMEARHEYEESIADLLGPCSEVLLDTEGRQISPDWLDVPEKVILALLRHGIIPGEDRHLLVRVPNPFIEPDEEKVFKILASIARANALFLLACDLVGVTPRQNAIHEITVPQVNSTAEIGAVIKIGTLYQQAVAGLFDGPAEHIDAFLGKRVQKARRAELLRRVAQVRLVPLCENVGALAHLPDLLEAFYLALERGVGVPGLPTPGTFATSFERSGAVVRVFVAMSDTAEQSGKIATDAAYTLAIAFREEAERRLAVHARRLSEPPPLVTFLIGAGRAGFRGGFDPDHPGVIKQFARADGVTLQGIRTDAPEETSRLAAAFRAEVATGDRRPALAPADVDSLMKLLEAGVKAHTEMLLRIAPLLAPFGSLVPQTRVRIRATGSVNYGRSIPSYPEEWGGGTILPDNRDLRDAWPEGVTLPRAIVYNLACTTLGLPAVTSDLGVLDRRAAVLLERHAPGYREIVASELPRFVREAAALGFGRKLAETTARRCQRAAAALWVDARAREELIAPTCLFAMEYLRYLAEVSESWDETKEHESQTTREEELIRETSSVAFVALCSERPGERWPLVQTLVDAEDAPRLLLARELTIEEKREFVDLRIEGWLRTLPDTLAPELRREWSGLRALSKDDLTLDAIRRLISLEKLRGSRGA